MTDISAGCASYFSPTHCEWGEAARHMRVKTHARHILTLDQTLVWRFKRSWNRKVCLLGHSVCAFVLVVVGIFGAFRWRSEPLISWCVLWICGARSGVCGDRIRRDLLCQETLSGAEVLKERFLTQKPDLGYRNVRNLLLVASCEFVTVSGLDSSSSPFECWVQIVMSEFIRHWCMSSIVFMSSQQCNSILHSPIDDVLVFKISGVNTR